MIHSFDTEDAEYLKSTSAATVLYFFKFWIKKNKANDKNKFPVDEEKYPELEGQERYFTYNSSEALQILFKYLSKSQIRTVLKKLIDKKVLITGKYSKNPYDHTTYYALYDEKELDLSILANRSDENNNSDLSEIANPSGENDNSYTDTSNSSFPFTSDRGFNENPSSSEQERQIPLFAGSKKRRKGAVKEEKEFSESQANDIEYFYKKLKEEYKLGIDINYYYNAVKDWCDTLPSRDKRKRKTERGWIATARTFMRSDREDNKLKMQQSTTSSEEQDMLNYLNKY